MGMEQLVFKLKEAEEKSVHGGSVICRILLNEERGGARNFSFLVNTMKSGLNCDVSGKGHAHEEEHCMYVLSGTGGVFIEGERHPLEPDTAVFIPPGAMHHVYADPSGDLTYIVIYAPPGPEKEL